MPNNNDWFTSLKEQLIALNLTSVSNVIDILDIYKSYPEGFQEVNLAESFEKIRNVHEMNVSSLRAILSYINYLEESSCPFLREDLISMVEMLAMAFQEQDKYVLSIIRYILVKQGAVAEKERQDTYLEQYRESSIYGYDIVEITNKKILRKIKKERSNDFE